MENPIYNPQAELVIAALRATYTNNPENDLKSGNCKYVIYARKSTESTERQVRSLDDQVAECLERAKQLNLTVVKVFKESVSAKEPDIRPLFREMISGINSGKYHGIIAWHPDRLARNMKDAGEIIDLIDKDVIKDIKFVSFIFDRSASGKMLLGIAFVLSKQYSDQLSDNVHRGINRSIQEGKYLHVTKIGYYKDPNQFLRPDGSNFTHMQKAFELRLAGKTYEEIATYMQKQNVTRKTKEGNYLTISWNKKRVCDALRDPIYCGFVMYGDNIVYLPHVYDFVPTVEMTDFLKINQLSSLNKAFQAVQRARGKETKKADLMRGMVICGECNKKMTAGITSKKTSSTPVNYYYFRCDTSKCKERSRSIRARVIIDAIHEYLSKQNWATRTVHNAYIQEVAQISKQKNAELIEGISALKILINTNESKAQKIKNYLLDTSDKELIKSIEGDLKQINRLISEQKQELSHLEDEKSKVFEVPLELNNFIKLFQNISKIIQNIEDREQLDEIIRKIFLNFTIVNRKVAKITINPPFGGFTDNTNVTTGRAAGT